MSAPSLSQPKRLHRMNRFEDLGPFPGGRLHGSNDQCDGRNLVHLLALRPCGRQVFRWFSRNQELVGAVDGKPIELSQSARLFPWKGRQRSKHSRKFRT
jgi:hypothetical protein